MICDSVAQCRARGELRHALAAGAVADTRAAHLPELGAVISGRLPGRRSENAVTVAGLTGVGVQDTAIARLALARAHERSLGHTIA